MAGVTADNPYAAPVGDAGAVSPAALVALAAATDAQVDGMLFEDAAMFWCGIGWATLAAMCVGTDIFVFFMVISHFASLDVRSMPIPALQRTAISVVLPMLCLIMARIYFIRPVRSRRVLYLMNGPHSLNQIWKHSMPALFNHLGPHSLNQIWKHSTPALFNHLIGPDRLTRPIIKRERERRRAQRENQQSAGKS